MVGANALQEVEQRGGVAGDAMIWPSLKMEVGDFQSGPFSLWRMLGYDTVKLLRKVIRTPQKVEKVVHFQCQQTMLMTHPMPWAMLYDSLMYKSN